MMRPRQMLHAAGAAVRLLRSGQSDELRHVIRNRWNRLDLDFVSLEELGLPPERAHTHSASRSPAFDRLFKLIPVAPGSVVLDYGSGKGGAVIALARQPFAEIIGVEISPQLIRIARQNAERLGLRNVRFVQSDAAAFTDLDRVTHIFMFNPFPCPVLTTVMANLAVSLARAPRPLVLIYRFPLCHQAILDSGLFILERAVHPDELLWHIYRHDGGGHEPPPDYNCSP